MHCQDLQRRREVQARWRLCASPGAQDGAAIHRGCCAEAAPNPAAVAGPAAAGNASSSVIGKCELQRLLTRAMPLVLKSLMTRPGSGTGSGTSCLFELFVEMRVPGMHFRLGDRGEV